MLTPSGLATALEQYAAQVENWSGPKDALPIFTMWDMSNEAEGYPCRALLTDADGQVGCGLRGGGAPKGCRSWPQRDNDVFARMEPWCSYSFDAEGVRSGTCNRCMDHVAPSTGAMLMIRECCENEENLVLQEKDPERPDVEVRVCKKCDRRHITVEADAGDFTAFVQ